jgi:uncharacterized protein YutE (UPF0331/DUF86 family)
VFRQDKDNYPIAAFWLRTALEAVITIGTHILSHMPSNGKKKDYTRVIKSLGEHDIVSMDFSERIRGMAGYRNRLVHMYWEISGDELHTILQTRLDDLVSFGDYIKKFLTK